MLVCLVWILIGRVVVLGDHVLILWDGFLILLCKVLLVSMDLLENMRWQFRIGILLREIR